MTTRSGTGRLRTAYFAHHFRRGAKPEPRSGARIPVQSPRGSVRRMAGSAGFEAAAEAVAGAIGGFVSSAVLFPLDYVKTQQQAGTEKGNFLSIAAKIYKKHGALKFYGGAQWRGFQSGYEKIIYFYFFAFARNAYVSRVGSLDPIMNLVIGYIANWCQVPFTMPVDTCVNGMITTGKSFGTMASVIWANPRNAYRGMAAYSVAALKPAVQFTVYEQMRARFVAANAGGAFAGGVTVQQASIMGAASRIVSDTLLCKRHQPAVLPITRARAQRAPRDVSSFCLPAAACTSAAATTPPPTRPVSLLLILSRVALWPSRPRAQSQDYAADAGDAARRGPDHTGAV